MPLGREPSLSSMKENDFCDLTVLTHPFTITSLPTRFSCDIMISRTLRRLRARARGPMLLTRTGASPTTATFSSSCLGASSLALRSRSFLTAASSSSLLCEALSSFMAAFMFLTTSPCFLISSSRSFVKLPSCVLEASERQGATNFLRKSERAVEGSLPHTKLVLARIPCWREDRDDREGAKPATCLAQQTSTMARGTRDLVTREEEVELLRREETIALGGRRE
mmetsp:Transcript_27345/g.89267  ORF Transcript_27345/g.89267 Transcript_27345/m.89267 type:complete len:224 (-) Transcript_27345:52-723(-)